MAGYLTNGLPQFTGPFTGNERLFLDTTIPGGAYPQLAYVTFTDLVAAINGQITAGGTPEWLPEGALDYAGFVNGHYYAGGAEVAVLDMYGPDPDNFGGTLNPADITPGQGYLFDSDGFGAIGDFRSAILAGAALVIEWIDSAADGGLVFVMYDSATYSTYTTVTVDSTQTGISDNFGASNYDLGVLFTANATMKLAAKIGATGEWALSVNGSSAATLTPSQPATPDRFSFTCRDTRPPATTRVRSMTLYPSNADLPTLSTP